MTRTRKWRNWARTERSQPAIEVAPRSVEQVVLAVERARETGHSIKPIGASHSFSGIGATDGIRLDMSRLRGLVDVDLERSRVTLWAGTHLYELPEMLHPLGLALENMGDIDRQTISGAISTGTHGTGLAFGGIATSVVGVTLVTGTGELITVDETENAELLPAVALSLGALGVLLTVTVQCVPRYLVAAHEAPAPLEAVLNSWVERSLGADHFEFFWFPHTTTIRTKTNTRLPVDAAGAPLSTAGRFIEQEVVNNALLGAVAGFERFFPEASPRINRAIETMSSRREYSDESHRVFVTPRRVRFREMEYALPHEAVPEALREIIGMIERKRHRVSFPIEVRTAAADSLHLSTAQGRDTGYIAVHRYWRDRDHEYFRDAEQILARYEGRPHWGKVHTRSAEDLGLVYPEFDEFAALRDALDPDRLFANPYLSRVLGP